MGRQPAFLGFFRNIVHQRFYVPVGCPARNDHVVGYWRHVANIEFDDILRFDVVERVDDKRAELLAIHALFSSVLKCRISCLCLSPAGAGSYDAFSYFAR